MFCRILKHNIANDFKRSEVKIIIVKRNLRVLKVYGRLKANFAKACMKIVRIIGVHVSHKCA